MTQYVKEVKDAFAADPEVSVGRMLVAEGLKVRGKFFALLAADRFVVKLPTTDVADRIASGRGHPFFSGGRQMKEWVEIPLSDMAMLLQAARDARCFVADAAHSSAVLGKPRSSRR